MLIFRSLVREHVDILPWIGKKHMNAIDINMFVNTNLYKLEHHYRNMHKHATQNKA